MRDLVDHFQAMARNNAWSNHRLARACAQLAPGAFEAPRVGFFPSLKKTLNHILTVVLLDELPLRRDELQALGLPET